MDSTRRQAFVAQMLHLLGRTSCRQRDRGVWRALSRVDPGSLGPDPPQSPVRRAGAAGVEWSSPAALQTPAIPHSTFSSRVGSSTSHHPTSPLGVQMQRHRRLDPRTRRITYHPGFNPAFFLLFSNLPIHSQSDSSQRSSGRPLYALTTPAMPRSRHPRSTVQCIHE